MLAVFVLQRMNGGGGGVVNYEGRDRIPVSFDGEVANDISTHIFDLCVTITTRRENHPSTLRKGHGLQTVHNLVALGNTDRYYRFHPNSTKSPSDHTNVITASSQI